MEEFFFDLGTMSQQKEDLIGGVVNSGCRDCGHPLTAHTGTDEMRPWTRCARTGCRCLAMGD